MAGQAPQLCGRSDTWMRVRLARLLHGRVRAMDVAMSSASNARLLERSWRGRCHTSNADKLRLECTALAQAASDAPSIILLLLHPTCIQPSRCIFH